MDGNSSNNGIYACHTDITSRGVLRNTLLQYARYDSKILQIAEK